MADEQDAPKEIAAPDLDSPGEADDVSYLKGKKDFVTAGTRIHKWTSYLGVDWIFNAFSGVSFAYLTKYTQAGQKYWSGPITNFFTKILSPLIKDPAQLEKSAGYGNMFMSIIAGGMFTLPPLMVLESKKIKLGIIKFFDRMIYGKDKVENDPKLQQAYEDIGNEPKKDFTSGLIARFAALAPLLAIVLTPTTKKATNKIWFDHVEHASDFTARKVGFSENSFKTLPAAEAKERWKFIHESVAMDFGLGVPYAILHSFFYNIFAGLRGKKDDDAPEKKAVEIAGQVLEEGVAGQNSGGKFAQRVQQRAGSHTEREAAREAEATAMPDAGTVR